jgi:predicted  nucleic acid-binding Zn-ribbon protein
MVKRDQGVMGPGGKCVCIRCGFEKPHQKGSPCREEKCPECGIRLFREGSPEHQKVMAKKAEKDK